MLTFSLIVPISQNVVGQLGSILQRSQIRTKSFSVKSMGDSHHISGQLDGNWKQSAQVEILLSQLSDKYQGLLTIERSTSPQAPVGLPYQLEVTFLEDHSKTFSSLMQLFSELRIIINSVDLSTTPLGDQTQHITITRFSVLLPLTVNIQYVREQFYGLCETLNMDGSIEMSQG